MADGKKRHGCLTAWLSLMIVANALSALSYVVAKDTIQEQLPSMPDWAFPALIGLGAANVIFSIALLFWKKWGFYGFIVTSVVALAVNLKIGIHPGQAIAGLLGVAILYAVLQIGDKETQGWTQLE